MLYEKLYQFGIRLYGTGIKVYARFNSKAQVWVKGRERWEQELKEAMYRLPPEKPRIWVHVASLGEFEQGRPVMSALHRQYPDYQIVLSFFSPSGYEVRKNYPEAAYVCYMPLDTPDNAFRFVQHLQPVVAIFVKYEFWYHHLTALEHWGIPVYLISARFRDHQIFFRPWGGFFRRLLFTFDTILVQDQHSEQLLRKIGLKKVYVTGDSRVDRVMDIATAPLPFPDLKHFIAGHRIIVFGSSWEQDEAIFCQWINQQLPPGWKVIIAPHETSSDHVQRLQQKLKLSQARYSQRATMDPATQILVIDNVGLLAHLYQFASIAYVGGGFGKGIHSILEPTAFGIPVVTGPRYHKFEEAIALKTMGALFPVKDLKTFSRIMQTLCEDPIRKEIRNKLALYFGRQQGATQSILQHLATRLE